MKDLKSIAQKLDSAAVNARAISQISNETHISLNEAYSIQKMAIDARIDRGFPLVGIKMGFTSIAKMEQMGVHDMIWGLLTSDMLIDHGGSTQLAKYIHPRAEPEICFRIAKRIDREIELDELDAYVDAMAPAIEIIDSRFENFKFSLEDVVADNCSSTGLVIGDWQKPRRGIDQLSISLRFDGAEVASGSSSDILGDPWKALQAATRLATSYGRTIEAGEVVMAGAATAAVFMKPGVKVSALVEGMPEVSFHVE
jgi:2-keto-4-pentenoate hydratase